MTVYRGTCGYTTFNRPVRCEGRVLVGTRIGSITYLWSKITLAKSGARDQIQHGYSRCIRMKDHKANIKDDGNL